MKINYGSVTNQKTNVTEQVEFNPIEAVDLKSLLIGFGLTVVGIGTIIFGHIKSGADAAITADINSLIRAGIMDECEGKAIGKIK